MTTAAKLTWPITALAVLLVPAAAFADGPRWRVIGDATAQTGDSASAGGALGLDITGPAFRLTIVARAGSEGLELSTSDEVRQFFLRPAGSGVGGGLFLDVYPVPFGTRDVPAQFGFQFHLQGAGLDVRAPLDSTGMPCPATDESCGSLRQAISVISGAGAAVRVVRAFGEAEQTDTNTAGGVFAVRFLFLAVGGEASEEDWLEAALGQSGEANRVMAGGEVSIAVYLNQLQAGFNLSLMSGDTRGTSSLQIVGSIGVQGGITLSAATPAEPEADPGIQSLRRRPARPLPPVAPTVR